MFTSSIYSGFERCTIALVCTVHIMCSPCVYFVVVVFYSRFLMAMSNEFTVSNFHSNIARMTTTSDKSEKSNVEWVRELNMTKNKKRRRQHNTNCNNNANTHTNISVTDRTIYFDEPNWFFPASPFILNALCRSIEICWLILCIIFSSFLFGSLSLYLSMAAFIPNSFHVISVRYKNSFSCDYEIAFPRSSSTHIILSS